MELTVLFKICKKIVILFLIDYDSSKPYIKKMHYFSTKMLKVVQDLGDLLYNFQLK